MPKHQCVATVQTADEACYMTLQCTKLEGHEEPHRATYPGLEDNDAPTGFEWTEPGMRARFRRNRDARQSYMEGIDKVDAG